MFGLGGKLAMGMGVALLMLAGTFYWYYQSSQAEIKQLVANNATLEANVATLKGTIAEQNESIIRLEDSRRLDQEKILSLSTEFNAARKEVSDLRETFSRHDFGGLSLARPKAIERIINAGTKKEGKEFLELTTPRVEVPAPKEEKEDE